MDTNRIIADIDTEISKLQQARALLSSAATKTGPGRPKSTKPRVTKPKKLEELISEMGRHCDEVNASGAIEIEYEIHPRLACVLRHDQLGMIVRWNQRYEGSVQKGGLCVEEYNSRLFFNNEIGNRVIVRPPSQLHTRSFPAA